MSVRLVALLTAVLLSVTGCSRDDGGGGSDARKPDRLPDVTLTSLTGAEPVELSTLRGPLVINLWASWCAPCRKELPEYQAFAKKYAGRVDVLGIDFQETRPSAARALARATGVTYPLLSDPDGELRAIGLPKVILLDAEGRVQHEKYVKITSVEQLEEMVRTHLGVAL